ncbi:uncharacterized protein LOC130915103 [Corythoichthys intestinalis]|uniref:uncharacterized protein LOC130915103 n=1 Tax=Corythoichthys intestinalis TaxID=161448 RepID=UPI0025A583C7|nr:uncharacterized protein LOC130915103 [Corythoichthys intestinalis]
MVKACVAVGCTNREDKRRDLKFYRIPREPERRARWTAAIRRENWAPNHHHRLCSSHFISGKKNDNPRSPDYVPSIFSYKKSSVKRARKEMAEKSASRQKSKTKRQENFRRNNAVDALLDLSKKCCREQSVCQDVEVAVEAGPNVNAPVDMGTQTSCTMDDIASLEKECRRLRTENLELKRKLSESSFDESGFTNENSAKVTNFTGLPCLAVLMAIFELVKPHMTERRVSKFQQVIICLLKMKFFINNDFLACLFKLSSSTVSRIFLDNIELLYKYAVPALVFWPDGDIIRQSLPACFYGEFKNCTSIIDCVEFFIAIPSDLQTQAQTYSQYKSHNTIKFLISITPQGHISFISKGWGGRTSDKYVTDHSGYLDKLKRGDVVLADRDFDVANSIALRHATLHIPRSKSQLDTMDVSETRKIANVRIHVERVLEMVRKKMSVLNSVVPFTMIQSANDETTCLDKIVAIACALCNACPPIVPSD